MPNRILKTIFKDFFKLRYVIIWLAVIIFIGAGVVWAAFNYPYGMALLSGRAETIDNPFGNNTCVVVGNTGTSAYFIPTRTRYELTQFNVHAPLNFPDIKVSNCVTCATINPCTPTDQCGTTNCGLSCGTCPANQLCNISSRICEPVLGCGNPQNFCPQDQYCSLVHGGSGGVCLPAVGCANSPLLCAPGYYCNVVANPLGICLPLGIY